MIVVSDSSPIIALARASKLHLLRDLIEAKKKGLIPGVKEIMDEMRRQGVGVDEDVYNDTLKQAGEIT